MENNVQITSTIKQSVFLAGLAYQHPADIQKGIQGLYGDFKWLEDKGTDTQAFICQDDQNIFITPRGTEIKKIEDIKIDLDYGFVHLREMHGCVHRGFNRAAKTLYKPSRKYVESAPITRNIIFGGHSLGSGIATELARMYSINHHFEELNQIAGPRSMDASAATIFGLLHGKKVNRLVNNNDVVTRIPPRFWGYRHIFYSNLFYFKETGELVNEISAWDAFLDRMHGRFDDIGKWGTDGLTDHPWINYWNLMPEITV